MTVVSAERTSRKVVVCYDIKAGRVVKGASVVDLTDQGDPAGLVAGQAAAGADELVLLDIAGAREGRAAFLQVVERACRTATVPVCVGGGVRSVDDVAQVLAAGADKVGMNSAAVADPELVSRAAAQFGSDRIVVAIDAKRRLTGTAGAELRGLRGGGLKPTGLDAVGGRANANGAARARSSSPASTATGNAQASTWSSPRRWRQRYRYPLPPAAGPAAPRISWSSSGARGPPPVGRRRDPRRLLPRRSCGRPLRSGLHGPSGGRP